MDKSDPHTIEGSTVSSNRQLILTSYDTCILCIYPSPWVPSRRLLDHPVLWRNRPDLGVFNLIDRRMREDGVRQGCVGGGVT